MIQKLYSKATVFYRYNGDDVVVMACIPELYAGGAVPDTGTPLGSEDTDVRYRVTRAVAAEIKHSMTISVETETFCATKRAAPYIVDNRKTHNTARAGLVAQLKALVNSVVAVANRCGAYVKAGTQVPSLSLRDVEFLGVKFATVNPYWVAYRDPTASLLTALWPRHEHNSLDTRVLAHVRCIAAAVEGCAVDRELYALLRAGAIVPIAGDTFSATMSAQLRTAVDLVLADMDPNFAFEYSFSSSFPSFEWFRDLALPPEAVVQRSTVGEDGAGSDSDSITVVPGESLVGDYSVADGDLDDL